jgi:hypothetical protein
MLTKNTDKLRREVAAHVEADRVIQGTYWDEDAQRGCFIGCLNHSDNPSGAEEEYGLPIAVQRIAETIFENLPADEARAFFAALPDVMCDGKNLSLVHWQFLASELRNLPPVSGDIQSVIDPVVAGLDLLASGQQWSKAEAAEAAEAAAEAAEAATEAAARAMAMAMAWAAKAATRAAGTAQATWTAQAAQAATWATWAAGAATWAATVRRQRDLLLRLIRDAEVQS